MQDPSQIPQHELEHRLFELSSDALIVTKLDGTMLRANAAAADVFALPAAELTGGSIWARVDPDDAARAREAFDAGPLLDDLRMRVVRSPGEVRWVEVRGRIDRDAGLCHIVARDITDRDEADAERLGQAFSDSPTGIALIDIGGGFRRVNPALARLLGTTEESLLSRSAWEVTADPAVAERWTAQWEEQSPRSFEVEARLRRDDGEVVVALVSGTLVDDLAGAPLYYLCQFQDVTARVEAQYQLASNEAKLAEAQQVARLGSWAWAVREDAVTWSDELYRIHGLRPDTTVRSFEQHVENVHPQDRARVVRAIEGALAEGRNWNIDHRIVRPDGETRMIHARGEVEFDGESRPLAVHGTCQDVTEQRGIEDALRNAEQLFRRAFDDAPIGMALIDLEGRWLRLNRAIAMTFGRTEAEMRASSLDAFIHPDDVELDEPLVRELLAGRRRSYALEKRYIHADGHALHVLAHVSLMHGDGERPLYFLVQLVDLSERRRADAERHASEQRLQAVIDNAPALIAVKDPELRYVLVNRRWEELSGVAAAAAIGRTTAEIEGGLPLAATEDYDRQVLATGEPYEGQLTLEADGTNTDAREFILIKFPLFDSQGEVGGVCTIATDVTERRRSEKLRNELEQRLSQAQRLESVGQLAGGVAHDFNNLLSVIITCVDFAQRELETEHPVRGDVVEIGRAAERAAALTRQLLMFSRREVVTPVVLDLGALVLELESLLARSLGERIALEISCEPDLPAVLADRSRMEQVLVNLAVNARDAMPAGGPLSIAVGRRGGGIEVSVRDRGTGMPPEVADRAFEPFFTTKAQGDGTGLGLATVHGIIVDSGGEIAIDSTPGEGTEIRFVLPAVDEPAPSAQVPEQGSAPASGCARVLVVEDQEPVRRQAVRVLEAAGYAVTQAAGADEALRDWGSVDLLLTDVVMPGMTGHELAERALELSPGLAVVYMSGHTEDIVVLEGARERELHFVQKPFSRDSLLAVVEAALSARERAGVAGARNAGEAA